MGGQECDPPIFRFTLQGLVLIVVSDHDEERGRLDRSVVRRNFEAARQRMERNQAALASGATGGEAHRRAYGLFDSAKALVSKNKQGVVQALAWLSDVLQRYYAAPQYRNNEQRFLALPQLGLTALAKKQNLLG